MFFAIDLLIPRHNGKFSLPWVVATRGIRHAKKKELGECDVADLCEELLKMVICSSNKPRTRFSLSLAIRLINGTVKIYEKQVDVLHEDLVKLLKQTLVPTVAPKPALRDSEETADVLVTAKKRQRKAKNVVLSEDLSPELVAQQANAPIDMQVPAPNQVDSERITLREELPINMPCEDLMLINVFGDLGTGEEPDIMLPEQVPVLSSKPALESTPTKRKANKADMEVTPSKRKALFQPHQIIVEAQVHEVSETVPQHDRQVDPEVMQVHTGLEELQQMEVPTRSVVTQPIIRKPCNKVDIKNVVRRKVRRINRCGVEDMEIFEWSGEECGSISEMEVVAKNFNLDILAPFLGENEDIEQFVLNVRESERSKQSLLSSQCTPLKIAKRTMSAKPSGTPVPPVVTTASLQPQDLITQAPIAEEDVLPPTPMDMAERIRVSKPILEDTAISRPLIETIALQPLDGTQEATAPPAAHHFEEVPHNVESIISLDSVAPKIRQRRIRDIIKNWYVEMDGDITIEDICMCPPPHSCLGIAMAFEDLLCMQAMDYVKLNRLPSMELGTIEKGERMLRK